MKFIILGCGRIGATHSQAILRCRGASIAVCVDRNMKQANKFAKRFGAELATSSLKEALEYPDTEAVIVALPSTIRREPIFKCLKAGKDVLVEKPFSLKLCEAKRLFEKAQSLDRLIVSGQCLRFAKIYQLTKKLIAEGKIGNVLEIIYRRTGLIEQPLTSWWSDPAMTKGFILHHHASHTLDLLLWMLGERARSIDALSRSFPGFEYEDSAAILMNTEKNTLVTISESFRSRRKYRDIIIIGSEGTIAIDGINTFYLNDRKRTIKQSGDDLFTEQIKAFVTAAKLHNEVEQVSSESVVNGIEALEAAMKSRLCGRRIKLKSTI